MKCAVAILFLTIPALAMDDSERAQSYLRARLAKMHTGHNPEFYVRDIDPSFTNMLAELSCRIDEVKPGSRVLIWTRTEREGICQANRCAAALPVFPSGETTEKLSQRHVRLFAYGISNVLVRSTSTAIIMRNAVGAWSGPIAIQIMDAPELEKHFP